MGCDASKFARRAMSDDDRSAPDWRERRMWDRVMKLLAQSRELVDLFRSYGRTTVRDVCGVAR
jgi:hypothetical protein